MFVQSRPGAGDAGPEKLGSFRLAKFPRALAALRRWADVMCDQLQLFPDSPRRSTAAAEALIVKSDERARSPVLTRVDPKPVGRGRRRLPSIFHRPGFCLGCGEERCVCDQQGGQEASMLLQLPPPGAVVKDPKLVMAETLRKCCIGSHAAFVKLLADRSALSDAELRAIVARLNEVLTEYGRR